MFGVNYGAYYDELCMTYGEQFAFERYQSKVGKYAVVSANEDDTTRLFIRAGVLDINRKDGWWNTFTICKNPVKKGFYIAKVDKVTSDKNGYPIFVVSTLMPISEKINEISSNTADIFLSSDKFVYHFVHYIERFSNLKEYCCGIDDNFDKCDYVSMCSKIVDLIIDGKIDVDKIEQLLSTPTKEETEYNEKMDKIHSLYKNVLSSGEACSDASQYPNLVRVMSSHIRNEGYSYNSAFHIEDLYFKYERAVSDGHIEPFEDTEDIFGCIERYLVFDNERKEKAKAAKKAAKKAKKAAAKKDKE